ncbi:hypothetical protein [Natrialba chahannaoensis]|nr:hypothetical protein [Natrialba chahannaoensis]
MPDQSRCAGPVHQSRLFHPSRIAGRRLLEYDTTIVVRYSSHCKSLHT